MVEGDDRSQSKLPTGGQYAPVMVERRDREFAFLRFDPGPFDAEAKGIEAESRHQGDVVAVTVIEVAGIAGGLDAWRAVAMLPLPPIAVGIAAFDLMGRRRSAEEEAFRKGVHCS